MVPTTYPTFEDRTGALSLMEQFELQVENEPGRLAAWYEESSISFGELNRRSNQLARYLRKRGVATDSLVGLCIPRSIEMLIALFGIMKAGGGYLPLDPCYPAQRISYMIEDSQIRIALCRDTGSSLLLDIGCLDRVELVDLSNTQAMQESGENLAVALDPDDLAYVIYTAGSTGTPKGVMGTHRGMLNRLNWMWQKFPFEPDEVCCLNTSLNFLDSFWGIFGPLLQGIPIVLIPDATVRDPLRLLKQLEQFRTTRMVLVPSLLRVILDHYGDAGARLEHLRIWVSSGEALPGDPADRFRQILPHSRLLNLYGSSELSADCTWYEVTKHPDEPVAIGQPIANNRVYILDENLREVPAGELGGIYVSGECLARGYYRNPGFTAQRFVANPLGPPGDRIYRTGDIGRIREGEIEYLGRADHQVKIRGFRVELGEIE